MSRVIEAHLRTHHGMGSLCFSSWQRRLSAVRFSVGGRRHATALRPFFATSVNSFNDAPRGLFSPRSHWLTRPVVTLR